MHLDALRGDRSRRSGRYIRWHLFAIAAAALVLSVVPGGRTKPAYAQPASIPSIQSFQPDATFCIGGAPPSTPIAPIGLDPCGAGSSSSSAPAGVNLPSYLVLRDPPGSRLSQPVTMFGPQWATAEGLLSDATCDAAPNGACQGDNKASQEVTGGWYLEANLFCHAIGFADILADPASVPPSYSPFPVRRTSQEAGVGGGGGPLIGSGGAGSASADYAFIESVQPFPRSFTFVQQDSADITGLFLGGAAPAFPLAPSIPLIEYTRRESFGSGAFVTYQHLAGRSSPPDDQYLCVDSPQNSIVSSTITTALTPGYYPVWTLMRSAPDVVSRQVTRVLDVTCVAVGTPFAADIDHDCLGDDIDPDPTNADIDHDSVPDGVEAANGSKFMPGSCPTPSNPPSDCDLDAASDFDELFQFTDPLNPDTDGDGSLDRQDTLADENLSTPSIVDDTTADDNCPAVYNPDQTNTDAQPLVSGAAVLQNGGLDASTTDVRISSGTFLRSPGAIEIGNEHIRYTGFSGLGTPTLALSGVTRGADLTTATAHADGAQVLILGDATNPGGDQLGNACDPDADNDGIPDIVEPNLVIMPWSGYSGANKTVCRTFGTQGASFPLVAMDPLNPDEDGDGYLSGVECAQRARPDVSDPSVATCATAPVDPQGCARPGNGNYGSGDPDADGLGMPGGSAPTNNQVETFYRTRAIVTNGAGGQVNDLESCPAGLCSLFTSCGPDGLAGDNDEDSDCDMLSDGAEVNFYGTSPASPDTDGDGCSDGREAASVNGDRAVTASDLALIASRFGPSRLPDGKFDPVKLNLDFNKDGVITAGDLGAVASLFGNCPVRGSGSVVNVAQ
jgi:hypothetical protein